MFRYVLKIGHVGAGVKSAPEGATAIEVDGLTRGVGASRAS